MNDARHDPVSPRPRGVFLAVNASFSHAGIAAGYFKGIAESAGWDWHTEELVRGEAVQPALVRVCALRPRMLAATFYLFTRQVALSFIRRFKALQPECLVVAGGPEFLGDNRAFLEAEPAVDLAVRGEGENAFAAILANAGDPAALGRIPGVCRLANGAYQDNGAAAPVAPLDAIPSPYPGLPIPFKRPFILLETTRGCANACSFCTSAGTPVRSFSAGRVRSDLEAIRARGIREVRVANRTFNDRAEHCLPLLRMFRDEFPELRFHLEIDPARVTPALLREFETAVPGRFHVEAGVQTLCDPVLRNLGRQATAARTLSGLRRLRAVPGLKLHADLIAGLPGGTLEHALSDLLALSALGPDEIQLEVLKLLPGTRLASERGQWGMVASPEPPYEVLRTGTMGVGELENARRLSRVVEWFYNPPDFTRLLAEASRADPGFWPALLDRASRMLDAPDAPGLETRYRLLAEHFDWRGPPRLRHGLGYQWLKRGFSAMNGIVDAAPWRGPVPGDAELVEGDPDEPVARAFRAELDLPHIFAFGRRSDIRSAVAVYRLPPAGPGRHVRGESRPAAQMRA
ncbi:MAG: DUF4080 domain-containing protein [Lentisphaerae bacterium]|nr:DUF4080 domain-containing protein [Lentisphaerota bacterium]